MEYNCILLRYGEIGLKSKKTRSHFEKRYIQAICEALKREGHTWESIENFGGRFVIFAHSVSDLLPVLKRVPGIQSLSLAYHFAFENKADILTWVQKQAVNAVRGHSFCVRVRRVGQHSFDSLTIAKEAGALLFPFSTGVNLKEPEVTVQLEIRNDHAFLYTDSQDGTGGLPPCSSGRVLALFSGGIDSPVAAYLTLKRGCQVDFLLINLLGEQARYNAVQVYNFLINQYAFGYVPRLFIADGRKLVAFIQQEVPDRLRQIALKIAFYQLGEALARHKNYLALITGESLSQKSSQTLASLTLIESQCNIPVFRPLLCMDKKEITQVAHQLGTLAASERVKEYCNLAEGKVATAPTPKSLKDIPSFSALIETLFQNISVHTGSYPVDMETAPIAMDTDLVAIDIRPKGLQEHYPLKHALSWPYSAILEELAVLDRKKSYLIICDFGVRSEDIADAMRNKGFKAAGVSVGNYQKYFEPLLEGAIS